jgi:hypothetical protein
MVTYFLMIDYILFNEPIPIMKRVKGLLNTLEAESDCQPLPVLRVLAII